MADTSGLSGLTRLPDYGFGPVTPTSMAGYPNGFISSREPDPTWGDTALSAAEFPARALVNQFDAAGTGIADAINEPSLPNITNAGVQTGLALMSPELAVGSGALGYGTAALRDLSGELIPSADARRLHRAPRTPAPVTPVVPAPTQDDPIAAKVANDPQLSILYGTYKQALDKAAQKVPGVDKASSDAIRQRLTDQANSIMNQITTELAKREQAKRDAAQKIYDQQVQEAVAARDLARSRDRRFTDTEVGKVYDKVGVGPVLAGLVPGVVSGLAKGPAETGLGRLGLGLEGAGFGIGAAFAPDVFNVTQAPASNPEKEAMEAYAYNLPDGHPDKIKAKEYADSLPDLNPVQTAAKKNLTDPWLLGERILGGGAEGMGGALVGQYLPRAWGGFWKPGTYDWSFQDGLGALFRPRTAASTAERPAPSEAASKLLAGNDTVLDRTSGPVGPASGQSLPVLGDSADIAPAAPVTKAKASAPRNKSGGSKGSSKPAKVTSVVPPALPDSQTAASDELKRFFGAKQAPTLDDLKGFATGGRVSIDEAAKSVSASPTLSQKEAGNYKKAHVRLHGLDIAIENPRGSERFGVDKGGKRWSVNMPDHYGYIKRTEGKDGDHVDCYIGPNENSTKVFVVDQKDAQSGHFDEHKVMLGYPNKDTALNAYKRAFSDGKGADRIASVTSMNVHQFKSWLRNGDTTKPIERQKFASGGAVHENEPSSGFLHSPVAGRTDHIPASVVAGSYVFPADFVSSLGEGNTLAGKNVLQHLMENGPNGQFVSLDSVPLHYASGGKVPIMAAGGEFIAPPHAAARWGNGDLNLAHSIFDKWVTNQRENTINELKSLPPPQK